MEKLGQIFNSTARVKIMRLFLFNGDMPFETKQVAQRSKITPATARKELALLQKTGFLKKKKFTKVVELKPVFKKTKTKTKKGEKVKIKQVAKIKKTKAEGWVLNRDYPLAKPLETLLIDSELGRTKDLHKRFKETGRIKMLVLSGIFVKDDDRKVDIVIVGEKFNRKKLENTLRTIESEVGKELRYSVFTPEEFSYRLNMYDKHLLDVFENHHERIVDTLKVV